MDRPVLRSERYKFIIMVSNGLSLVGIMIFHDLPKMFTKGYIVIDHWRIWDILVPLLILSGLLFVATKYLSNQNRIFKEGLIKLRPKYFSILKGTFKKGIPGVNDLREETVEIIQRSIRPKTRLLLYESLYGASLLFGVVQAEREKTAPLEIAKWLKEKGYPDRGELRLFEERVMGLLKDEVSLFRFIETAILREERFLGPKWRIFSQVLGHEFYKVDNIPSYLAEFHCEQISREGLLGLLTSFVVFSCLIGGGIFHRILPINLFSTRNRIKG